jgi:hypothetical protein
VRMKWAAWMCRRRFRDIWLYLMAAFLCSLLGRPPSDIAVSWIFFWRGNVSSFLHGSPWWLYI